MKKISILLLSIVLIVSASCSSGSNGPDENRIVTETIDPTALLESITEDSTGDVTVSYGWIPDNTAMMAREGVSGSLVAAASFSGYDFSGITICSGTITYTFHGNLTNGVFQSDTIAISSENLIASVPALGNDERSLTISMEETEVTGEAFTAELVTDASGEITALTPDSVDLPEIEENEVMVQDKEDIAALFTEIRRMTFDMAENMNEYWDFAVDSQTQTVTLTLKNEYVDPVTGNKFLKNDGKSVSRGDESNYFCEVSEYIVAIIDGVKYVVSNNATVNGSFDDFEITRTIIINGLDITDLVPIGELPPQMLG